MRITRLSLGLLGVLLVLIPTARAAEDGCTLAHPCRLCTSSDKENIKECADTGKIETLQCLVEDDETLKHTVYRSCKRTSTEEEFRVVRLEVFCLLIGGLALLSLKRQKVATASLFDQRRMAAAKNDKRRTSDAMEVEMTSQETVPLTDNSGLEVV